MANRVTMKDVALKAEVSLATVSKVINNDKTVGADKARRVWDAARALDYKTNYAARLLKTSRNNQICVIIPSVTDPNFAAIFTGAERVLYDNGYAATLHVTSEMRAKENFFLEQALEQRASGVIIVTCQPDEESDALATLAESDGKVVYLEREPRTPGDAFLEYDNRQSILDATDELLQQGLRRLLLLTGPRAYSSERRAAEGFSAAIDSAANASGLRHAVVETSFDKETAFAAVVRHINRDFVPEAIIATGTQLYKGALKATDILRNRLANKVKLVVLGEESWANVETENITVIRRNSLRMGELSAEAMLDNLRNPVAHKGYYRCLENSVGEPESPRPAPTSRSVRLRASVAPLRALVFDSTSYDATTNLLSDFESRYSMSVAFDRLDYIDLYHALEDKERLERYDIVQFDHSWLDELVCAGALESLDAFLAARPEVASSFLPGVMQSYAGHAGGLYALPYRLDTQLLFYRRDLFENQFLRRMYDEFSGGGELRPPQTWREFNSIAKFFTRAHNPESPTAYGIALGGQKPHGALCEVLPRLWAFGGEVLDGRGRVGLDSRNAVDALENYVEAMDYASPGSENNFWREQVKSFCSGQTAMATVFSAPAAPIADRSLSEVVGRIGYDMVPGGCPLLGGWALGVRKGTPRFEDACNCVVWAAGSGMAIPHTLLGGSTACAAPYESSEMMAAYPWLPKVIRSLSISHKRNVTITATGGRLREWEFEEIVGGAAHRALIGELSPSEAVELAAGGMRAALAGKITQG
jgi:DNA-binding LacI/PurR family transcriptional regulator/ABC-type glycerol-3-phosphate transport system substrate-binding protein